MVQRGELLDVVVAGVQEPHLLIGAPAVIAEILIHEIGGGLVTFAKHAGSFAAEAVRGAHSVL